MMLFNLSLLIVVMFAVLEIRADSPISPEEATELTQRFSADDLKRARDAGISDRTILTTTSNGWTLNEMIEAQKFPEPQNDNDIGVYMRSFCKLLFPNQNPTTLASAQENNVNSLYKLMETDFFQLSDLRPFYQAIVCPYLGEPNVFDKDVNSFGSEFIPYVKIQYMKTKAQNASGEKRIRLVKEMCCLYQGKRDMIIGYVDELTNTNLRDEDLNDFNNQWNAFETANTSKALENVCDFLHANIPFKECPEYVFL